MLRVFRKPRHCWKQNVRLPTDPESLHVSLQLLRGLEDDSSQAKVTRRLRVGRNVVYIDRFLGPHFAGFEGFTIDQGVGLARSHAEGINSIREKTEEGKGFLRMGHVEGIG